MRLNLRIHGNSKNGQFLLLQNGGSTYTQVNLYMAKYGIPFVKGITREKMH